jgi:hypothetical protein
VVSSVAIPACTNMHVPNGTPSPFPLALSTSLALLVRRWGDTIGLGTFAVVGAQVAVGCGMHPIICRYDVYVWLDIAPLLLLMLPPSHAMKKKKASAPVSSTIFSFHNLCTPVYAVCSRPLWAASSEMLCAAKTRACSTPPRMMLLPRRARCKSLLHP